MATPNTREKAMDFEERIRVLLECPVCIEPLLSVPIHQCINGHVVCNDCIAKLNNCPICRNDSTLIRNLMLEEIIEKILVHTSVYIVGYFCHCYEKIYLQIPKTVLPTSANSFHI